MEARAAARPDAPPDCPLYPRLLTFRLVGYALLGQSLLLALFRNPTCTDEHPLSG
jgi:hypothetical protein